MEPVHFQHSEISNAARAEDVWFFWQDVQSWSDWDRGIEWCRLDNPAFAKGTTGSLKPYGAPAPLQFEIIECTPNVSFTDRGAMPLGTIFVSHLIEETQDGIKVTHSVRFEPHSEETKGIFVQQMQPKFESELAPSVKALLKLAEARTQAVKA